MRYFKSERYYKQVLHSFVNLRPNRGQLQKSKKNSNAEIYLLKYSEFTFNLILDLRDVLIYLEGVAGLLGCWDDNAILAHSSSFVNLRLKLPSENPFY